MCSNKKIGVQTKVVTHHEIDRLIEICKEQEHPFYYRFRYSIKEHLFYAKRIRKDSLDARDNRRSFHCTDIDHESSLGKAMNRITQYQGKIYGNI